MCSVAIVDALALTVFGVQNICNICAWIAPFVASHQGQVTGMVVTVVHPFTVGIGHAPDSPPAVILKIVCEGVSVARRRNRQHPYALTDIAKGIVFEGLHPAAIHDTHRPACSPADISVGICHVVFRHITVTFMCQPVVCIMIKNLPQRVGLPCQVSCWVISIHGCTCIGMNPLGQISLHVVLV